MAHGSVANSKTKAEIASYADICVVQDNCLVIHDHNRPVNVYPYKPKDGHRSAKTVDSAVSCHHPQSGQKFTLMIKQAICIDGLGNHLLCSMMCCLNGVYISEVPKFQAESLSMTTHAI